MYKSKPLLKAESNDSKFVQEILKGDGLGSVSLSSIMNVNGVYNIFEFQLVEEKPYVNPHTAHVNSFWHKGKNKFISLKKIANALNGNLYLVHYAKEGRLHHDKVKVVKVKKIQRDKGIVEEKQVIMTRTQFSRWYRYINKQPLLVKI